MTQEKVNVKNQYLTNSCCEITFQSGYNWRVGVSIALHHTLLRVKLGNWLNPEKYLSLALHIVVKPMRMLVLSVLILMTQFL